MSDVVTVTHRDGVAVITLHNPPVNGLGFALRTGLRAAIDAAASAACRSTRLMACRRMTWAISCTMTEYRVLLFSITLRSEESKVISPSVA